MKTHNSLLTQLVIKARVARHGVPHELAQRVRIDISVQEVDILVEEARANRAAIEDLKAQVHCLQLAITATY